MLKKILSENNHDAIIASIGYTTTVPTKLRTIGSAKGLTAGAWLRCEVMG